MVSALDVAHFRTFGFVVLRGVVDGAALSDEVDRTLRDGSHAAFATQVGGQQLDAAYVPMMCGRTPMSLALLERFAAPAAALLGGPVLPVRAKCVRYAGATSWHRDSAHDLGSVGFACYLEPLEAASGALRVLPGSHWAAFGAAAGEFTDVVSSELPGLAVPTRPGDAIVFDEHLFHASSGGRDRRQWRVDFVGEPPPADREGDERLRAYFAGIFPSDWDGGYDVDAFPSYGPDWLASGAPWIDRLRALGVYDLARTQEAFTRRARGAPRGR
jgi:hypothetical protein